jgi:hypothetical protein
MCTTKKHIPYRLFYYNKDNLCGIGVPKVKIKNGKIVDSIEWYSLEYLRYIIDKNILPEVEYYQDLLNLLDGFNKLNYNDNNHIHELLTFDTFSDNVKK